MKTTLKIMALLLCLVMLVPCFAACAGEPEVETTADAGTQAPTQAPTGGDEPTQAPTGGDEPTQAPTVGDESTQAPTQNQDPTDDEPTQAPTQAPTQNQDPTGDEPTQAPTGDPAQSEELPTYTDDGQQPSSSLPPDEPDEPDEVGIDKYASLDGYVYKAYVRSKNTPNGSFACEDFWVQEASSDPLSFAVYQRNSDIEDEYDCKIKQYDSESESQYEEMKRFFQNDENYELAIVLAGDAAVCAISNLLYDIRTLDNIRLENATYDKNSVEQFTMGGCLYYFSGDMNISPLDCASVTVFNRDLFKTRDFAKACGNPEYADLYKMVENGTWTVSAMLDMATVIQAYAGTAGGVLDAREGDTVGYFQYHASAPYYFYGCGARLSTLDVENGGYPEISYDSDKAEEVFNFLYEKLNTTVENPHMPCENSQVRTAYYATGQTLFTDLLLWDVRSVFHKNNYVYGILPIPKYDAEQERYFDVVWYGLDTAHLWAVPKAISNADYASFLLNVIAVYSARPDNTMDAYYTKTLELAVAQDAGSRATLKIVRDSLTYDICILYDWGGFIASTLNHIYDADANHYGDATNSDQLDVAEEEMNLTLEGFKDPQLSDKN